MNIPVYSYKIFAPLIPSTFSMLFNNSLSEGIFPECCKTAKFIQVFKSVDSNSTVDYRPISMLPFLSKIFEKWMCARLDCFQKSHNILCTNPQNSAKIQIHQDEIIEFRDSKQSTIAPYLDFSEAFDAVNHDILMSKLQYNAIRGVMQSWFKSYLSKMK